SERLEVAAPGVLFVSSDRLCNGVDRLFITPFRVLQKDKILTLDPLICGVAFGHPAARFGARQPRQLNSASRHRCLIGSRAFINLRKSAPWMRSGRLTSVVLSPAAIHRPTVCLSAPRRAPSSLIV